MRTTQLSTSQSVQEEIMDLSLKYHCRMQNYKLLALIYFKTIKQYKEMWSDQLIIEVCKLIRNSNVHKRKKTIIIVGSSVIKRAYTFRYTFTIRI